MRVTALYIAAAVACILAWLLISRVKLSLSYKDANGGGDLSLTVRYTLLRLRLIPSKEVKIKLGDYTYEKTHKKKKQKPKASAEKKAKAKRKAPEEEEAGEKNGAAAILWELKDAILDIIKRVPGKLRLNIKRLRLSVGAEDAAKTAITYGAVTQAVGAALALASEHADVRIKKRAVLIEPDFLSGKLRADVDVTLSFRVGSVFGLALRFVWNFIKLKISSSGEKTIKAKG